jgi:hypothetical protein
MKIVYQCDNCEDTSESRNWIFHCLWCNKEICESCMFGYATCKECAKSLTEKIMKKRFYIHNGTDEDEVLYI